MGEIRHPEFFSFRNFSGRTGYLAVSSLLKFFVQLSIVIIYSHQLSLTDYGIYQFIWMYINFFSVLSLFGITNLMLSTPLTSLTQWIKINKGIIIFGFLALNTFAAGFLLVYATYFTTSQNILLIALLFLQNLGMIAESIAIKKEQEKKLLYSNLVYTIIYAFIHFYLLYNTYSVSALLQYLIIATCLKCVLLLYGLKLKITGFHKNYEVGKQWFLLGINDILGVLVKWIDKWLILLFLPPAAFAVYFNGTYEIPVFMIILGSIGSISLVDFSKIREAHANAAKSLFERTSLIMASIVFPAFCFLFFYSDSFIHSVFGDKYTASIPVFKISIFILPVRIIYSTTVLQVFKRTDLIVKGSILDLIIAILLMWLLYPVWGMQGLASAFVISTYIQVGFYLYHTGKLLHLNMEYLLPFKKLFINMGISAAVMALGYFSCKAFSSQLQLAAGIIISLLLMSFFIYSYYADSKKELLN